MDKGDMDIIQEYLESKYRRFEAGIAVIGTGVVMLLIDMAGRSDRITGAVDGYLMVVAVFFILYLTFGMIHDSIRDWVRKRREKKYIKVPWRGEDVV